MLDWVVSGGDELVFDCVADWKISRRDNAFGEKP